MINNVIALIMSCPKNLYLDLRPCEFFNFIFKASSNKPKQPKLKETNINIQIYILFKSAHKSVLVKIPIIIIIPPIVGVPDFFIMWSIGPSCLIGPVIIFSEKIFIKGAPIINTTIRDVTTDNPVRNVKYLKTFKKEYWSMSEVNKLNNI